MARISARDAQTIKEADYKKPVIHIINVKYEYFEAQFNSVIELNGIAGAVFQLGNIDGGIIAIDDHYKVIAESLSMGHKIRGGGPGKPIFYIGFYESKNINKNLYIPLAHLVIWGRDDSPPEINERN